MSSFKLNIMIPLIAVFISACGESDEVKNARFNECVSAGIQDQTQLAQCRESDEKKNNIISNAAAERKQ